MPPKAPLSAMVTEPSTAMAARTRPSSTSSSSTGRPTAGGGDELGAAELARNVAESLRKLRRERALSLDQLAAASGVSRAALSQIEGARTNPTLGVLWKIAVGLRVPFHSLMGAEPTGKSRVLRASDVAPLRSTDGRMESRLLSPAGSNIGIEVYELRFQPKGVLTSDAHASGTTETLMVLTGALRITVDTETHDLVPGDSIFFRADVPHGYANQSSHEARCIDLIAYGRTGA
jgi:XRE family transcriptional regulator, regulator of sulfur utilization